MNSDNTKVNIFLNIVLDTDITHTQIKFATVIQWSDYLTKVNWYTTQLYLHKPVTSIRLSGHLGTRQHNIFHKMYEPKKEYSHFFGNQHLISIRLRKFTS